MPTEEKKEGEFDPGCVIDIYDKLTAHNFALQAFGALLRSSALDDFADQGLADRIEPVKDVRASNLRWGLSQLIELYLSHQERILTEYVDQYNESDTCLLKGASHLISAVQQRAFVSREVAITKMREAISSLDIVINRNGELQDKALYLKSVCEGYIKQLRGKCEESPGV